LIAEDSILVEMVKDMRSGLVANGMKGGKSGRSYLPIGGRGKNARFSECKNKKKNSQF